MSGAPALGCTRGLQGTGGGGGLASGPEAPQLPLVGSTWGGRSTPTAPPGAPVHGDAGQAARRGRSRGRAGHLVMRGGWLIVWLIVSGPLSGSHEHAAGQAVLEGLSGA